MIINRLLILSTLPLIVAVFNVLAISNKTIANQSQEVTQSVKPNKEQRRPPIDFAKAAKKLGITEAQLKEALMFPPEPPPLDIRGAAKKLNVTEEKLIEVLELPPRKDCFYPEK